jgi:hypothetical protein
MERPLRREAHGGCGERPGETGRGQPRDRAPGLLNRYLGVDVLARSRITPAPETTEVTPDNDLQALSA